MFLHNYLNNILNYDLVNKFKYFLNDEIPCIKKVVLTVSINNKSLKTVVSGILILRLISGNSVKCLKKKKPKLNLKLKKGEITGCQVVISKKDYFTIFSKLIYEVLPYKKTPLFLTCNNNNYVSFNLSKLFFSQELDKFYVFFKDISRINLSIVFKSKNVQEINFLLNSLKIITKIK